MIDPRHGRDIPEGREMVAPLRRQLQRLGHDAMASVRRGGMPNLSQHAQLLVKFIRPMLVPHWQRGGVASMQRIGSQVGHVQPVGKAFKAAKPPLSLMPSFSVYNPLVSLAIDQQAYAFAASTLSTLTTDVQTALGDFRQSLREGMEEGEAGQSLTRRVGRIFADPYTAQMIASSEASRAQHAGAVAAARQAEQELGIVVKKEFIASSDACDVCLSLDGKVVALDEPFAVIGRGAYSVIQHPPVHPFCACSQA